MKFIIPANNTNDIAGDKHSAKNSSQEVISILPILH
jgi:hypothetical protein